MCSPDRLRGIVARWRAAGYAETGRLGPGPAWCWLTRAGLAALGLRFAAGRPSLGRLAHLRAVLAARLALESSPAGQAGQPWWRSERRIRAAIGGRVGGGHVPDAEACWAEIPGSPYPGERWAIEAELTPKPLARTAAIMAGLLDRRTGYSPGAKPHDRPRYDRAVYLVSPASAQRRHPRRRAVARTVAGPGDRPRPAPGGDAVVTFWAYLRFQVLLWALRATWRVLKWAIIAAVLIIAAPVTVVAAVAYAGAWLRGWPPAKLWRAAAWSLPMTGVYLAGRALQARTWRALALAPVHDWEHAWHLAQAGRVVAAFVLCAPVGVPAALCAAGTAWAWRIYAIDTGLSGKTATAPVIFDARQWRRQARTARARITAPGPCRSPMGGGGS